MGRHRTVRYQLRQSQRRVKSPRRTSSDVPPHLSCRLAQSLQRYSFLLWIIALATLIGATTAAVKTILDPNASIPYSVAHANGQPASAPVTLPTATPRVSSSPTPLLPAHSTAPVQAVQVTINRPAQASPSPISAGGVLLMSCATGCFLLSQWVKPRASTQPHFKSTGLIKSNTAPPSTASQPLPLTEASSTSESVKSPNNQPSFLVSKLQPASTDVTSSTPSNLVDLATPSDSDNPAELPVEASVTIVPADRDHPLDWDEPSLADSLDLRQRRPLSYWL